MINISPIDITSLPSDHACNSIHPDLQYEFSNTFYDSKHLHLTDPRPGHGLPQFHSFPTSWSTIAAAGHTKAFKHLLPGGLRKGLVWVLKRGWIHRTEIPDLRVPALFLPLRRLRFCKTYYQKAAIMYLVRHLR